MQGEKDLPEEQALQEEVQVPGEEIGHQVLHCQEQRQRVGWCLLL